MCGLNFFGSWSRIDKNVNNFTAETGPVGAGSVVIPKRKIKCTFVSRLAPTTTTNDVRFIKRIA